MRFRYAVLLIPAIVLTAVAVAVATRADRLAEAAGAPPVAWAVGAEADATAPVPLAAPVAETAAPRPDRASLSPMMREILDAWDAHQAEVTALETRIETAAGPMQALALQQKIESLRQQVEIEILTIQARHARQEGRLEQAAGIEAAIVVMTTPPQVVKPVGRRPHDGRGE